MWCQLYHSPIHQEKNGTNVVLGCKYPKMSCFLLPIIGSFFLVCLIIYCPFSISVSGYRNSLRNLIYPLLSFLCGIYTFYDPIVGSAISKLSDWGSNYIIDL